MIGKPLVRFSLPPVVQTNPVTAVPLLFLAINLGTADGTGLWT